MRQNSWLWKAVMYSSLQEREKREFSRYKEEREILERLSEHELSSRYVHAKAMYVYEKNTFAFFLIAVLIGSLTNAWKLFYELIQMGLKTMTLEPYTEEMVTVGLMIAVITILAVTLTIFILFVYLLKMLYITHRELLIIEEVRNSQSKSNEVNPVS